MTPALQIVTTRRPLITAADWDRHQQALMVLELRTQADNRRHNAAIALSSVPSCLARRDAASTEADKAHWAERSAEHARRYENFIATAREYDARADEIEAGLAVEPMLTAAE